MKDCSQPRIIHKLSCILQVLVRKEYNHALKYLIHQVSESNMQLSSTHFKVLDLIIKLIPELVRLSRLGPYSPRCSWKIRYYCNKAYIILIGLDRVDPGMKFSLAGEPRIFNLKFRGCPFRTKMQRQLLRLRWKRSPGY